MAQRGAPNGLFPLFIASTFHSVSNSDMFSCTSRDLGKTWASKASKQKKIWITLKIERDPFERMIHTSMGTKGRGEKIN